MLQIHKMSCHFRLILLFYAIVRMEAIVMYLNQFPVIDLPATGANIRRLRQTKGLSVRDLQQFFGFEEPQAIYKWQRGQSLPTVDNLYALSTLLGVPMNDILVAASIPDICTTSGRSKPAAQHFMSIRPSALSVALSYRLRNILSLNCWFHVSCTK